MTIEQQFINYLDNQINNPMFTSGEEERDIPFTAYNEIKEDGIQFIVDGAHAFYYNCYSETVDGGCYYEFELAA